MTETGLLILFVEMGLLKENSLVQPPIPWLFMPSLLWTEKKIQGFQDGTESLVPHEGGELSKHRDCFWQEKCKKKYSSLLGLCLILEEMKLLTPWRGKSPQNMKIYGVCCSLIKYWTSHQSGNFYGGEIFVSLPLLVLGWDQGITC